MTKEALAQPEQEPVAWKPDRSGKYLTVVYRDVIPGDEVGAIVDHPKCVIMSWSNAVHDVEQLKNPPQRTWVGLTDDEKETLSYQADGNTWTAVELAEAKLKEKNNG